MSVSDALLVKIIWVPNQNTCFLHFFCDYCVMYFGLYLPHHRFDPRAFRWAQTMRLAVEEINENPELLPNHTLGYKIFDSCAYPLTGQRAAVAVLNGMHEDGAPTCSGASPLVALIGESGSAQSIVVSRILQPFRIPMVVVPLFLSKPFKHLRYYNFLFYFTLLFLLYPDQLLFFMCMFNWQKSIPYLLQSNP